MTMTKQHFEAIALALKESKPAALTKGQLHPAFMVQWRSDVRAIAGILLAHNPRFDTRFYAACGYETTEPNDDMILDRCNCTHPGPEHSTTCPEYTPGPASDDKVVKGEGKPIDWSQPDGGLK